MGVRPLHFRAIDRMAAFGNQSTTNPFLAAAFSAFFEPLGIRAKRVEFSMFETLFGNASPLYAINPRFDLEIALRGARSDLFIPLREAADLIEISFRPGLELQWRQRGPVKHDDIVSAARLEAVGRAYQDRLNIEISQCQEYFRGFVGATMRILSSPSGCEKHQAAFLTAASGFVPNLLAELSAVATLG